MDVDEIIKDEVFFTGSVNDDELTHIAISPTT